jgi:S-formylglutathione hydrolase
MTDLITLSEHACFGGTVPFCEHFSCACDAGMRFAAYVPPQAAGAPVPVLYYLAGGTGAGFYLDATAEPYSRHYNMATYVTRELPQVVAEHFPASGAAGVFGHFMGGHGALTLALENPDLYASVSAFAPVCAPTRAPWGKKAFSGYLGPDEGSWREHDASELVRRLPFADRRNILVDQGTADQFLEEQLYPEVFEEACREAEQPLTLRWHEGYDHGYYFISTFMEDHIKHHAQALVS